MQLQLPDRVLNLGAPVVMGIINRTPDSFAGGGVLPDLADSLAQALAMIGAGAGIIDIGGESTRPGAVAVAESVEIDRVVPLIEALRRESDVVISIDTMKPSVMRAACRAGAEIINDVLALRAPGSISAALETGAAVCLMHMQGCPQTMQAEPHYDDVVSEVRGFLEQRIAECRAAGIGRGRLCVDPGIGFGKRLNHNVDLLAHTGLLLGLECPILIGASRKSMFGELLGRPLADRLPASLAAAAIAVLNGAAIVRTHDVRATTDAIRVAYALRTSQGMR